MDLMKDLEAVGAAKAAEIGISADDFKRIQDRVSAPLLYLALKSEAPEDALKEGEFSGCFLEPKEPSDEQPFRLDSIVALVPSGDGLAIVKDLRDGLESRGIQCLITASGAKDFVYLFDTGFTPASEFSRGKELVIFFKAPTPAPLFWARQTNAGNYDMGPEEILAKLREWEAAHDLRYIGAGWDWVHVELKSLPEDLDSFCLEVVDFCYDLLPDLEDWDDEEDEDDEDWDEDEEEEDDDDYERRGAAKLAERLKADPVLRLWWD